MEIYTKSSIEVAKLVARAKFVYNRRFTTGKQDFWKVVTEFKDGKSQTIISEDLSKQLNFAGWSKTS